MHWKCTTTDFQACGENVTSAMTAHFEHIKTAAIAHLAVNHHDSSLGPFKHQTTMTTVYRSANDGTEVHIDRAQNGVANTLHNNNNGSSTDSDNEQPQFHVQKTFYVERNIIAIG